MLLPLVSGCLAELESKGGINGQGGCRAGRAGGMLSLLLSGCLAELVSTGGWGGQG